MITDNTDSSPGVQSTMRLSIITDEISQDLAHVIDACQELGLTTVELRGVDGANIVLLPEDRLRQIAQMLSDHGLAVCSIASPFLKCHFWGTSERTTLPEGGFGSTEYDTPDQQFAILDRSFVAARILGAPLVRAFSFWRLPDPTSVRAGIRDVLAEATERTAQAGLLLALENEYACNVGTGAEAHWYLDQIPSSALGIIWDPGNEYLLSPTPYPDGYAQVRARVIHCHLKDGRDQAFVKMGTGVIDYLGQFRALAADGYTGALSLETHYSLPEGGGEAASRESLAAIRALASQAGIALR